MEYVFGFGQDTRQAPASGDVPPVYHQELQRRAQAWAQQTSMGPGSAFATPQFNAQMPAGGGTPGASMSDKTKKILAIGGGALVALMLLK